MRIIVIYPVLCYRKKYDLAGVRVLVLNHINYCLHAADDTLSTYITAILVNNL